MFIYQDAIKKATSDFVDGLVKKSMAPGSNIPAEIDISRIEMMVMAKGDIDLASGLSDHVQRPAIVMAMASTPIINMIPIASPRDMERANKYTINTLGKLSPESLIDSLADEGERVGGAHEESVPRDFYPHTYGKEAEATDEARARGGRIMPDPIVAGIMLAQARFQNSAEFNHILRSHGAISGVAAKAPEVAPSATGGSLPSGAYGVVVIPLSAIAMYEYRATGRLPVTRSRINKGNGTTTTVNSGVGFKSAATGATIGAGDTGTLTCCADLVHGAFGYAWFAGFSGAIRLHAVTTINSVVITAPAPVDAQAITVFPAADHSGDVLASDGQFKQIIDHGIVKYLPKGVSGVGSKLTKSQYGNSIKEIDDVLAEMHYNGATPQVLFMAPDVFRAITGTLATQTPATTVLENVSMKYPNNTGSGVNITMITSLKMPSGCIYFHSYALPLATQIFNQKNLVEIIQVVPKSLRNWDSTARKTEVGIYAQEFLLNQAPTAFGLILNIAV